MSEFGSLLRPSAAEEATDGPEHPPALLPSWLTRVGLGWSCGSHWEVASSGGELGEAGMATRRDGRTGGGYEEVGRVCVVVVLLLEW